MSQLVVIGFNDKHQADEALLSLLKLEADHLADVEDAVVVLKDEAGRVRAKAYHDLVHPGDLSNELWGGILSAVVLHRSLRLIDDPEWQAFDESFLTNVETSLQPNSSALFILVRSNVDRAIAELNKVGGKMMQADYSPETDTKIKQVLDR